MLRIDFTGVGQNFAIQYGPGKACSTEEIAKAEAQKWLDSFKGDDLK